MKIQYYFDRIITNYYSELQIIFTETNNNNNYYYYYEDNDDILYTIFP